MESDHLNLIFCIKSISLIFLEIARAQKPAFSQYFCDFEFDPESIRIRSSDFWAKEISDFDRFLAISLLIRNSRSLIFPILLQFGLDPELIRNWIAVNFWQRKLLILIRFGLFQVYWVFKVLWFSLYFCNFDLDPELIRIRFRMSIFQFFSKYFWRRLIILMLIFPI